jgi:hypothetical protein
MLPKNPVGVRGKYASEDVTLNCGNAWCNSFQSHLSSRLLLKRRKDYNMQKWNFTCFWYWHGTWPLIIMEVYAVRRIMRKLHENGDNCVMGIAIFSTVQLIPFCRPNHGAPFG